MTRTVCDARKWFDEVVAAGPPIAETWVQGGDGCAVLIVAFSDGSEAMFDFVWSEAFNEAAVLDRLAVAGPPVWP